MSKTDCLHEFFEEQADLRPDAPALICRDLTLSFRQVEERANELARFLGTHGARPGRLVGIYLDRSEMLIITMLAVLKSGAGYVPLDLNFPAERTKHILNEANITLLCTEQALADHVATFYTGTMVIVDSQQAEIRQQPSARLSRQETGLSHEDLCYVIYTSGTTGRPKGVMTEHCNAVSFVLSFKEVCRLTEEDVVYQGFSPAFDGSVEEIWMAYSSGAALVVGTPEVIHFGSEVARLFAKHNVTYFSTVPTFLSMIKEDLPSVKLLIVSGEQCPKELVIQWAKPGRRMLNVYGPTEITVNATAAECTPNRPVTIGKPLRGYVTYILNEKMEPVSRGEVGELFIGGPSLAQGYLNQSEITAKHFVVNPVNSQSGPSRLFRTGDLVQLNDEGEMLFLGRIDMQVKIHGFRIELSEIEAVLREHKQIHAAAVTVVEENNLKKLAAFVLLNKNVETLGRDSVLEFLQQRLPPHMVPDYLDTVAEIPTLTSGKTDRKQLPEPRTPLVRLGRTIIPAETGLERSILAIWEKVFNISPISVQDDFFADLGGHSLVAAQVVSLMRTLLRREVAIREVYRHPTIRQLAASLESVAEPQSASSEATAKSMLHETGRTAFERLSRLSRWSCTVLQLVSLYFIYGVGTVPFLVLFLPLFGFAEGSLPLESVLWIGIGLFLLWYPALLALGILVKWTVIGRYKPGSYPLWGSYYFRWWLVSKFQILSAPQLLEGTPLMSLYYRLMGAKVGKNCILDTSICSIFDLVRIGDDTCICKETQVLGYRVEDGMLMLGSIDIGSRCFIGIHSAIGLNSRMGDDCKLDDLSLLADGEEMKPGEALRGSPSQRAQVSVPENSSKGPSRRHPILFGFFHVLLIYSMEIFFVLVSLPALALIISAFLGGGIYWGIVAIFVSPVLVLVSFCCALAAVKAVLLGRVKPGVYSVESSLYLRKWFIDSLIEIGRSTGMSISGFSVSLTRPLYTTIYLPTWLRMLGAKIGRRAEISVVAQISPELIVIGDESFFADGSIVGGRHFFQGLMQVSESRIGRRSFVGNSAILPIGTGLGNQCLLGCLSAPPHDMARTPDGTEWLGSPPFLLPNRQKVPGFSEKYTYTPTPKLYTQRLLIDGVRILLPGLMEAGGFIGFFALLYYASAGLGTVAMAVLAPLFSLALAIAAALCVAATKWILMGRFKPRVEPLWSPFVWFNEVVNGVYESVAAPALSPLLGTPFFAPYLRLLGCKIGKHVFINTTLFGEFDLVYIGDYAALNVGAVIQNHLFEDRIMKESTLRIGDECSVGNMTVVLYDAEMQQGSLIGPLSLLMKGEMLPAYTRWCGIPTQRSTRIPSEQL